MIILVYSSVKPVLNKQIMLYPFENREDVRCMFDFVMVTRWFLIRFHIGISALERFCIDHELNLLQVSDSGFGQQ